MQKSINLVKEPLFEDDDYLIKLDGFNLSYDKLNELSNGSEYLKLKRSKFKEQDITTNGFESFSNRPSLRNVQSAEDLRGSIYTYAIECRNDMAYSDILINVKKSIESGSRRTYLRICNSFNDYFHSTETNLDVSCLSNIHYLKNQVNLIFRASDIKNELLYDIITIYEFFIKPIYEEDQSIMLSIYASTAQNVKYINSLLEELEDINE